MAVSHPKGETIQYQYTTGTITRTRAGHAGLVLPPLFITMVFCFGLVLAQQNQAENKAASAKQASQNKTHSKLSPTTLQTATPLTPIVVTPPSTATASTANPKVAAPAQPSKTSGSAVQAATPNNTPTNVIYEVAKPVNRTLSNFLR